jgi:hypothetical protein
MNHDHVSCILCSISLSRDAITIYTVDLNPSPVVENR